MRETTAHDRLKRRAAGKSGEIEKHLPGGRIVDAATRKKATEVERSGNAAALQTAVMHLWLSRHEGPRTGAGPGLWAALPSIPLRHLGRRPRTPLDCGYPLGLESWYTDTYGREVIPGQRRALQMRSVAARREGYRRLRGGRKGARAGMPEV